MELGHAISFDTVMVVGVALAVFIIAYRRKFATPGTRHEIRTGEKGIHYLWSYYPLHAGSGQTRYEISIETGIPLNFTLEPESVAQKMVKWLGFATEFQTGDEAFDQKVYIGSDDPGFCARLQISGELRSVILRTLKFSGASPTYRKAGWWGRVVKPYKSLACRKGRLMLIVHNPADAPSGNRIENYLENLSEVNRLLPAALPEIPHATAKLALNFSRAFKWILILGVAGLVFDTLQRAQLVYLGDLVMFVFNIWLAVIAITLGAIRIIFRKSSLGYNVFRDFCLKGIFGSALFIHAFFYNYNIYADGSAAQKFIEPITGKFIDSGRHNYYKVQMRDWHPGKDRYTLWVAQATYDNVKPGQAMTIYTHPGRLGYEWVETYHLKQDNE